MISYKNPTITAGLLLSLYSLKHKDMAKIIINSPKYGQKEVLVDDDDFDSLKKFNWWLANRNGTFYAARSIWKPKRAVVYMHRQIMKVSDRTIEVDHKDHNGLNNQRENIRNSTKRQNGCNKNSRKNSSSKYLGVCRHKATGKWRATIKDNSKQFSLGFYESEEMAALAYNEAAIRIHGEFANLNNIPI